jgi:hypothetical protein
VRLVARLAGDDVVFLAGDQVVEGQRLAILGGLAVFFQSSSVGVVPFGTTMYSTPGSGRVDRDAARAGLVVRLRGDVVLAGLLRRFLSPSAS